MQLKVVDKIILGFSAFGCLLILTSLLSYFGLSDIRQSAVDVVEEKMPVQTNMMEVKSSILSMATVTANGYHENTLDGLSNNRQVFNELSAKFDDKIASLVAKLDDKKHTQLALDASQGYVSHSKAMYAALEQRLSVEASLLEKSETALAFADEASALMLDLSYLESNAPDLGTLIGAGNNIDNKLLTLSQSIKELASTMDQGISLNIIDDLDYQMSNLVVDKDYINRLAQDIENDGIVEQYNNQHDQLFEALSGDGGMVALQKHKLQLIETANNERALANDNLDNAVSSISRLFESVTQSTLDGQNAILESVASNEVKSFTVLFIGVAAAIGLATWVTKSIAKPLARINKGLSQLSQGDLSRQLDASGNDEFAALADKVNSLTNSLRELVGNIHAQEQHLDEVTQQSMAMGEQSLRLVDEQREQVRVTSQNTQNIQHTSQSNLAQIEQAMTSLDTVSQQSNVITNLVAQNRQQVQEQAKQAEESAQVIHRLDENSRNIGSILDVIKTIAEQTNLLALNAAIEAARAGEQGRGFAVVADEVRTLANRTHNSTEEIESMIGSLQRDAKQAVKAIDTGREQAKEGVTLTEQVSEQVNSISAIIEQLLEINRHIVRDTQEQDSLLANVATSLNTIVQLAESSAKSTHRANQATTDIDREMESLRKAVQKFAL